MQGRDAGDLAEFMVMVCGYQAGRTVGWSRRLEQDRLDFAQDLLVEVLGALPRHDPTRGTPEALINIVAGTRKYSLLRRKINRTRRARAVAYHDGHEPVAGGSPDPLECEELRRAVQGALEHLRPEDRLCCELIARCGSMAAAARALGWTRDQVRAARRRALAVFYDEGLGADGLR